MDTLRGRYVHEHGTGAIITNESDDQGSPTCSVWVVITEVSKLQRNLALVVWVSRNGEIITFGLRHCLALLFSSGSRAGAGPCDEMSWVGGSGIELGL